MNSFFPFATLIVMTGLSVAMIINGHRAAVAKSEDALRAYHANRPDAAAERLLMLKAGYNI